eukprot:2611622-Ditylum_brightwellii.AAC.1
MSNNKATVLLDNSDDKEDIGINLFLGEIFSSSDKRDGSDEEDDEETDRDDEEGCGKITDGNQHYYG